MASAEGSEARIRGELYGWAANGSPARSAQSSASALFVELKSY
ncbi:MAG: hypothetical protein ACXVHQ_37160 [Solirubrobacteraceae bacterium]